MPTYAYRATAKDGSAHTADTPRDAARGFFARFPGKRKCNVQRGEVDGIFFTVRFSLGDPRAPQSYWRDVTPKTAGTLPDTGG